jgi:SAM-dependent methyltransferase
MWNLKKKCIKSLKHVSNSWESLAKHDPLWAILSNPDKKNNKWKMDEFMDTGTGEINELIENINRLLPGLPRSRALDFGCGAGRLTQALAAHFDQVDGIDISPTMIDSAVKYNRHSDRVNYHIGITNKVPFPNNTFDMIYSVIVFQHMHKKFAQNYIADFFRVLKPGGMIVFQALDRCLTQWGKKFASPIPNPFYDRCTIDMNIFPKKQAIKLIQKHNGLLLEIQSNRRGGPKFESYTCYVRKKNPLTGLLIHHKS